VTRTQAAARFELFWDFDSFVPQRHNTTMAVNGVMVKINVFADKLLYTVGHHGWEYMTETGTLCNVIPLGLSLHPKPATFRIEVRTEAQDPTSDRDT
jgi:hypothetical protein